MNSVIKVATECYRQVKYGKGFGLPTYFLFWVSAGVSKQAPGCTAAVARAPCAAQGVTRGCQGAFMAFMHLLSGIRYALMPYCIFLTFTEWMKTGRALKQRVVNCDRVVLKQNVKGGKTLRRSDGRQETI